IVRGERRAQDAGVELAAVKPFDLLRRRALLEHELDVGITLLEDPHETGERVIARGVDESQSQSAALTRADAPGGPLRAFGIGQHAPRLGAERLARRRQGDPSAGAVEQAGTELAFERLDLLTQRWLRDAELVRRPPEMQVVGDGQHAAQLPEFHTKTIQV